jgi:hypothetical protein
MGTIATPIAINPVASRNILPNVDWSLYISVVLIRLEKLGPMTNVNEILRDHITLTVECMDAFI